MTDFEKTRHIPTRDSNARDSNARDSNAREAEDNASLAYVGEKLCTDYQLYNFPTVSEEDKETHVLLNMG